MNKHHDISVIILSGGKSSRMGMDKALLSINGKTILEGLVEMLESVFENIYIASDLHGEFNSDSIHVVDDIYKGFGPLGGLHSGLTASNSDYNFVVPCDLPMLRKETIEEFAQYKVNGILISEFNSKLNPFPGIYPKDILEDLDKILSNNEDLSMFSFLKKHGYDTYNLAEIKKFSSNELLNMNKPEDYEKVKELLKD